MNSIVQCSGHEGPHTPQPCVGHHLRVTDDANPAPHVGDIVASAHPTCGVRRYRITAVRPHSNGGWWCDLEPANEAAAHR